MVPYLRDQEQVASCRLMILLTSACQDTASTMKGIGRRLWCARERQARSIGHTLLLHKMAVQEENHLFRMSSSTTSLAFRSLLELDEKAACLMR